MAGTLAARAAELREGGADRWTAQAELLKAVALHELDGDTWAVTDAVESVYGPVATAPNEPEGVPVEAVHEPGRVTPQEAGPDPAPDAGGKRSRPLRLPPWEHMNTVNPPKRSPVLIGGLLRRGHVGVLVAKAKSTKTWNVTRLAVAVATGSDWLGFPCQRGRVVFIDPETDPASLDNRFREVAEAMHVSLATVDANVVKHTLRGVTVGGGDAERSPKIADYVYDLETLIANGDVSRGDIALVIVDSCSAMLVGEENASEDVRAFFNTCLRVAKLTGAAVLCVHHEGKAASGDRDGMARGRGSSVWADSPDLMLSLVETFPPNGEASDYLQDGERAFCLEAPAIREFPPIEPKHFIWRYPLLVPDADGITEGWKPKSAAQAAGRASGDSRRAKATERAHSCECALLAHMYREDVDSSEGIPATVAAEICTEALGSTIRAQTLKQYIEGSDWLDVYQRSPQRWAVVPRHPRQKLPRTE